VNAAPFYCSVSPDYIVPNGVPVQHGYAPPPGIESARMLYLPEQVMHIGHSMPYVNSTSKIVPAFAPVPSNELYHQGLVMAPIPPANVPYPPGVRFHDPHMIHSAMLQSMPGSHVMVPHVQFVPAG